MSQASARGARTDQHTIERSLRTREGRNGGRVAGRHCLPNQSKSARLSSSLACSQLRWPKRASHIGCVREYAAHIAARARASPIAESPPAGYCGGALHMHANEAVAAQIPPGVKTPSILVVRPQRKLQVAGSCGAALSVWTAGSGDRSLQWQV